MSAFRFSCFSLAALGFAALLVGCATPPPADDPDAVAEFKETNDPIEPTNRVFYVVNDGIDTYVLRPVAKGYRYVVPQPVRNGVHNVLSNLGTPVLLTAEMLQGKPRRAGDATMRFLINSTIGVAGIFDVADRLGYPTHDNDAGITLASWGVPDGPFLFLPILGPSNPRDATGFGVDFAGDPFTWIGAGAAVSTLGWTKTGANAIDSRERVLDPVDQIKKTALDPYATFRSLYRQHRESQIEAVRDDKGATIPVWFPQSAGNSAAGPSKTDALNEGK
jgi:phospholipid-binding lipoprotein MlaA